MRRSTTRLAPKLDVPGPTESVHQRLQIGPDGSSKILAFVRYKETAKVDDSFRLPITRSFAE
jgi:hypothetical protein